MLIEIIQVSVGKDNMLGEERKEGERAAQRREGEGSREREEGLRI